MKLFVCQDCGNVLYFENRACERCGHRVAFQPERETMSAIEEMSPDQTAIELRCWPAKAERVSITTLLLGFVARWFS